MKAAGEKKEGREDSKERAGDGAEARPPLLSLRNSKLPFPPVKRGGGGKGVWWEVGVEGSTEQERERGREGGERSSMTAGEKERSTRENM